MVSVAKLLSIKRLYCIINHVHSLGTILVGTIYIGKK